MNRAFIVALVLVFTAMPSLGGFIPVTDSNWYFSALNWYHSNITAQSSNPGAYFKLCFCSTTTASLLLSSTSLQPNTSYMTLRYSLDDAPFVDVVLPVIDHEIDLAQNLNASVDHCMIMYIKNSLQMVDRWQGPSCSVIISGLLVDDGAFSVPANILSKQVLVYWDSIGEGVLTLGKNGPETDLTDNDSTVTWAMALAAALEAEISVVAFGRQGYTIFGVGNVPNLITPGNDTDTAWNKIFAGRSRLNAAGQFTTQPDYIFCGHGTNDGLNQRSGVTPAAYEWLIAVRSAAPDAQIFLTIPFGLFEESSIVNAFTKYTANFKDDSVHLISLGDQAALGLTANGPSLFSVDGVHPLAFRDGQLGAMLAAAALQYII